MPLTDEQLDAAARYLCVRTCLDPDKQVSETQKHTHQFAARKELERFLELIDVAERGSKYTPQEGYCAHPCSCAKFHSDPTNCLRKLEKQFESEK